MNESEAVVSERRRRTEGLERTMFALRDAREVDDVLNIVARGLGRDFRRPCTAYEFRDGEFRRASASDGAGISFDAVDLEALRLRGVIRQGTDDLLGVAGDGQLRALFVLERGSGAMPQDDVKYLRAVGAHAALALANALSFDQLRRYASEGAALTEAARTILGFTELRPLAAALCRLALRFTHAERACMYLNRSGELSLVAYAASHDVEPPLAEVTLGEVDMSRALAAAFGSAPLIVTRLRLPDEASTIEHNGLLVVTRTRPFDRSELRMIETLKSLAALAIRNVDLYEQSTKANRALAESNAFKDDLMAMFAHDFKGPLTVISGFSELMLDTEDAEIRRGAETISEQTRRLARLSEDALALAATQSAGFSLQRVPDDLVAFVSEAVTTLDAERRIDVRADEPEVALAFDRGRLRHAIDNLLGNALKYSAGRVAVRIRRDGDGALVEIADHGIGVPAGDLERIFSRFGRAANARSRGIAGSGVGLYIARKIVEVHGGELRVSSVENEGSTFTISLPPA